MFQSKEAEERPAFRGYKWDEGNALPLPYLIY